MREPTKELARSLAALYLATEASIADDVRLKVNTVVRDLTQRAEAAEAERDDIIAICRGTQVDDAAIHSMSEYVTEKLRIEAERDALRKDAVRLDWLESRTSFLVHQWQGGGYTLTLPQPPVDGIRPSPIGFTGAMLRTAIDAALAVQP